MLIDAPSYESGKSGEKKKGIVADHDTTTQILMAKYMREGVNDLPR